MHEQCRNVCHEVQDIDGLNLKNAFKPLTQTVSECETVEFSNQYMANLAIKAN